MSAGNKMGSFEQREKMESLLVALQDVSCRRPVFYTLGVQSEL